MKVNDAQLREYARRIVERDRTALCELYDATVGPVYSVALSIAGGSETAQQVVADLFHRVWHEGAVDPAAQTGVLDQLLAACRQLARKTLGHHAAAGPVPLDEQDLCAAVRADSDIHAALDRLAPLPRRLVSLAFFREMGYEEIARHTGLAVDKVASILQAALMALRDAARAEPVSPDAGLEAIVATPELARRVSRRPDHVAEALAMRALAEELANPCGRVLAKLVETALELCHAHSAGVSILEMSGGDVVFRWHAVDGVFDVHEGGSLPRDQSPCGIVVERNATQLVTHPERHFPSLHGVTPVIAEALLVPFHMLGEPVGTIWVLAHDDERHFDAEDARVLEALAQFASAAYVLRSSQVAALEARDELVRTNERLRRTNDRLWSTLIEVRPAAQPL